MNSRKGIKIHWWTDEEKEYLKKVTPGHTYKEIEKLMNEKFEFNFTTGMIKNAIGRYKLNTGLTGRFDKGHVPPNKGKKGFIHENAKKNWYQKGHEPTNHREVGSERVNIYGYTEIKVAEPNKWKLKHNIIWERKNGPVPKGYVLIFGDSNKGNLDINNLILVSKKQLLTLNRYKLIQDDADLTRTAIMIVDIQHKISDLKKLKK